MSNLIASCKKLITNTGNNLMAFDFCALGLAVVLATLPQLHSM